MVQEFLQIIISTDIEKKYLFNIINKTKTMCVVVTSVLIGNFEQVFLHWEVILNKYHLIKVKNRSNYLKSMKSVQSYR